jgi:hypothetical protein
MQSPGQALERGTFVPQHALLQADWAMGAEFTHFTECIHIGTIVHPLGHLLDRAAAGCFQT